MDLAGLDREVQAVDRPQGASKGLEQSGAIAHNLGLKIAMGAWISSDKTANDAEIIKIALQNPSMSQEQLGTLVGIKQNAVNGRLKRACFDEIVALNERFKEQLRVRL